MSRRSTPQEETGTSYPSRSRHRLSRRMDSSGMLVSSAHGAARARRTVIPRAGGQSQMPRGRTPVSRQPGSPVVGELSVHPPQEPAAPFRATCPVGSGAEAGQKPTLDDAPLARSPERQESANQRQRRPQGRYVNDPD